MDKPPWDHIKHLPWSVRLRRQFAYNVRVKNAQQRFKERERRRRWRLQVAGYMRRRPHIYTETVGPVYF